jgi:hypothetical protein
MIMLPAPSFISHSARPRTPYPAYHMARHPALLTATNPAPLGATFTLFTANRGKIVRQITG